MKPKLFIGSSVEGLGVAYSIQQNLTYDADVTVWDQGVFELSKTSIESLIDILGKSDFGIFVFTPDDISAIRNKTENVVRDNVIFEFGLFIGQLGRERVFFITPSDTDFHLPSDLAGVTPGKYDPNREDRSLQAATAPACHQIRLRLKKLGNINSTEETAKEPDDKEKLDNENSLFIESFIDRKYATALTILEKDLESETDTDKIIQIRVWLCYCKLKLNASEGIENLDNLLIEFNGNFVLYRSVARIYLWEEYIDKSISVIDKAIVQFGEEESLLKILADCYRKDKGDQFALDFLKSKSSQDRILLGLEQVIIYYERKEYIEVRKVIHQLYLHFPNHEEIRYQYARVAMDLGLNEIALFLLQSLIQDFPENSTYWGYLSNCYINLDFYDLGKLAIDKANNLAEEKEEWIKSNIGNMLKNKGFYSDGIKYFEDAIAINKSSEYAHERLSTSIKLHNEEEAQASLKAKEGRKLIREFKILESEEPTIAEL